MIALLVAQAAVATFAPPVGVPLTFSVTEVRRGEGIAERYGVRRRVIFRRARDGFIAELTTLSVDGGTAPGPGQRFAASYRHLVGRTVRVTLDRNGRATDVEDLAALWPATVEAIVKATGQGGPREAAMAERLSGSLRGAPRDQQVAMLGGMATTIIDTELAARAPGSAQPIRIPAEGGGATPPPMIEGTERVERLADGKLRLERVADGALGPDRRIATIREVTVDPHTGLIAGSRETRQWSIGSRTLSTTKTIALKP